MFININVIKRDFISKSLPTQLLTNKKHDLSLYVKDKVMK